MTNIQFPTSTPPNTIQFEIKLETPGQMNITSLVPGDEATANIVANAIVQTNPFQDGWEAEYRTLWILSGAAAQPVTTLEDVQAIPVPHWRRLRGSIQGDQLHLQSREVSDDGEHWRPYPEYNDLNEELRHPAFGLTGEVMGRFVTLQWQQGRIDLDPDPEGDLLDIVEYGVQLFNGHDAASWKARHEQFGGDPRQLPEAKRATFELRKLAPLFAPSEPPFMRQAGVEFWPLIPLEYSLDGKKWQTYSISDIEMPVLDDGDDDDSDPMSLLAQLFDMQVAVVTVDAAGNVQWAESEIPEQHAESLTQSIRETLGAGQPEVWAERVGQLVPEGQTGTPQAVRLQVMKGILDSAPNMIGQSFAPSAVTLDGHNWIELADEFDATEFDTDEMEEGV